MENKPFLILGGYGNAGLLIARLLLQETGLRLILAGRNGQKAAQTATRLNEQYGQNRVQGIRLDAADTRNLEEAFREASFVIVASSTARYAKEVAEAALAAGIDYLDIQYSAAKLRQLEPMASQIRESGHCFITEAGFHPGLPAALVRYLGQHLDSLEEVSIAAALNQNWNITVSEATAAEFIEEFRDYQPLIFRKGRWQKVKMGGMFDTRHFDFGNGLGRRYCAPMVFEEMLALPQMFPALRELAFYISGFNWFVDWLIFPIAMLGLKIGPGAAKPMGRLLFWSLKSSSKPPYGIVLKAGASGKRGGRAKKISITLYHQDGYMFTAIPVVACLLQYLDGEARKAGLWMMGHLVNPERLIRDMERLGIRVKIEEDGT